MKTTIQLTAEKFQDIYTDEQFRNQVSTAHGCYDANRVFKHKQTCSYPITYIVTEEQIELAKRERIRAKKQIIAENPNTLLFIGMGMTYEPTEGDDIGNFRIRTEFINPKGRRFFIELGGGQNYKIRVDHSIDRDLEARRDSEKSSIQDYYNYAGLERSANITEYTKEKVLAFINKHFECNFSKIVIDNYNISTEDIICKSPKSAVKSFTA